MRVQKGSQRKHYPRISNLPATHCPYLIREGHHHVRGKVRGEDDDENK
ncbi:hypothetical protein [Polynucleobacter sp. AP-Nino-20-G2]|nr:hypothetical protein [Polynucleobacter sp. AP-Nino-20-G2]QWE17547.1 hypothetical protein FD960_04945 [Polynucleobacter sp. AP-Nino-20-G2]